MTEADILLNYNRAMSQADRLESAARRLEKLSDGEMPDTAKSLRAVWRSESSDLYLSKLGKVQGDIKDTAESLLRITESIRETARAVRQSELRAAESPAEL